MNYMQRAWQNFQGAGANARAQADARMREQFMPQYMGIMGMDYLPDQQGQDGLISGAAGTPGGLMAGDLQDPRSWMKAGMGLMALPGYQQMGNQMINAVMQQQLGMPLEMMEQQRLQEMHNINMQLKNQELKQADWERSQMRGGYKPEKYAELLGDFQQDYEAATAKMVEPLAQVPGIYDRFTNKGLADITSQDILALMGNWVKMQRPTEGFMDGDANSMSKVEGMPSMYYTVLNAIGAGLRLPDEHVAALLRAHKDTYQSRLQQYDDIGQVYLNRAEMQRLQDVQNLMYQPKRGNLQGISDLVGQYDLPTTPMTQQSLMDMLTGNQPETPTTNNKVAPNQEAVEESFRQQNRNWLDDAADWWR